MRRLLLLAVLACAACHDDAPIYVVRSHATAAMGGAAIAPNRGQGLVPISSGGTGQTSANFAADFPPGLATLFVFNVKQMRDERSLVEATQAIPATFSAGTTPTSLVGATGGLSNPSLVARSWRSAILERSLLNECPQFSTNTDPGAVAISGGKFEIMILTRQHATQTSGDLLMNTSLGADASGFRLRDVDAGGGGGNYTWATSNGAATTNTLTLPAGSTRAVRRKWHVIDVSGDGTNQTMNLYTLGGVVAATVGPTANSFSPAGTPGQPITIGAAYDCTAKSEQVIGGIAIFARPLKDAAERSRSVAALYRLAEIDPNVDQKVVAIVGDSVPAGAVNPVVWEYLQAYLPGYRITQRGVSGTQTPAIATSLTDELTVETPAVVVVEGGINDINASVANATITANLLSMCTAAKAAGSKCILWNIGPGDIGGKMVTNTPLVNAALAAFTIPTQIDALFDANSLLKSPNQADQTIWNTIEQNDALHPNAIGNRALARGLADKIIALTGN